MKRLLALLFLAITPAFSGAASQPVVLFTNYSTVDASPHIGSTIHLYSAMVQPSFQVSVSVTSSLAGPFGSITLNSTSFATLGSQTLFVSDGQRAWEVPFFTGNPITINNATLIGGSGTPLAVADYAVLALKSFQVYGGIKVIGTPVVPGTQMWVQMAQLNEALRDDGFGADLGGGGDGLWRGQYVVTNLDRIFENAQIYAYGRYLGVDADQKAGEIGINIDAQLPRIEQYSFTTSKVNYNGVLYLSALSQGTSTPHHNNGLGTFAVVTNKNGCNVTVTIDAPGLDKVLPPITIPLNAVNRSGSQTWKGEDGSDLYLPDGVYPVTLGISDIHGVQGLTITSVVRVVSLRISIEDIVLTPSSLPTSPAFTDGLITRVDYRVVVDRENGGNLAPSLRVLNWSMAGVTNDLNEVNSPTYFPYYSRRLNTVFNLSELEFLKADGTVGIAYAGKDRYPDSDTDVEFLWMFRGAPDQGLMANCYTPDNIGTTALPSAIVWMPDGDKGNDWDNVAPFERVGTALAPTRLQRQSSLIFRGSTPTQGNYRLRLRAILTGLDALRMGDPSDSADVRDYCASPTDPPVFRSYKIHFAPSARPEGDTSGQGFGIYAENTTATLVVNQVSNPTGDTSPPFVINSNPAASAQVRGSDFGVVQPLSVVIRDDESQISSDSSVTRIVLKDPSGNQVLGSSRTDGGNPNNQMTVYFYPLQALSASGTYTMEVFACSVICMPANSINFQVLDERTPSVLSVDVTTLSEGIRRLTLNSNAFQGPFSYLSEIKVRLGMGNGTNNTVDWQNSELTLVRFVGDTIVEFDDFERVSPLTSTATAPTDSSLTYRLGAPLNESGQFEIRIKAVSKNGTGESFTGPGSSFIQPRIATQLDSNVLGVNHQFTLLNALVAPLSITITVNSTYVTPSASTISVVVPAYGSLGSVSGRLPLTGVPGAGWQMMVAGIGLVGDAVRYAYNASLPPRIVLHYDDAQLPSGVNEASLAVYGYNGTWQEITSGIQASQAGPVGNTFVITPPNGTDTFYAYAIFYPDTAGAIGAPTPTPIAFKDTRSFNPTHRDPLYRRARIYYSEVPASSIEARVYDTSGQLLRTLSVGAGIQLTDRQSDPMFGRSAYYFEWDGNNDSGVLARNGLYLIRWKLVRMDGVTEHRTRPVALIK